MERKPWPLPQKIPQQEAASRLKLRLKRRFWIGWRAIQTSWELQKYYSPQVLKAKDPRARRKCWFQSKGENRRAVPLEEGQGAGATRPFFPLLFQLEKWHVVGMDTNTFILRGAHEGRGLDPEEGTGEHGGIKQPGKGQKNWEASSGSRKCNACLG